MPSLQVLTAAYDRRFVTPARLSEIVGSAGAYSNVDALIGPAAEAADPAAALVNQKRVIDQARERIEAKLQGRQLYRQRYRSRQPGSDLTELELPQWPAQAEALEILGISVDTYRLNDPGPRIVYRDSPWNAARQSARFTEQPVAGTEEDSYRIDFWAGYLMPGQIDDWVADRSYAPNRSISVGAPVASHGSWTKPTDPTNLLRFECTAAGTTASSEPAWPTAAPWSPATTYATGAWALATKGPIGFWLEATTGGVSGATDDDEPAWPTTAGETVDDSTVTWTVREELTFAEGPDTLVWTGHFVEELPITLQELAAELAIKLAMRSVGQKCEEKDENQCMARFVRELRFAA